MNASNASNASNAWNASRESWDVAFLFIINLNLSKEMAENKFKLNTNCLLKYYKAIGDCLSCRSMKTVGVHEKDNIYNYFKIK